MSRLVVHTDGGARGNPGKAAIGAVISSEEGEVFARLSHTIGQSTNNVAEYSAVIAALEWIKNNYFRLYQCFGGQVIIQFYLDSTLVVNQLNGLFKVKDTKLRELMMKIRLLEQEVGGNVRYAAIPREKNSEADRLVNEALDKPN